MPTIQNWHGNPVEVGYSRGGTTTLVDVRDNLITTGTTWPSSSVAKKIHRGTQSRAFDQENLALVTRVLGYYCALQSITSEDAITWSVFGTLMDAPPAAQSAFLASLLAQINVPLLPTDPANIWLWRRLPHPDNAHKQGPEIDFGFQTPHTVILGEAKWHSNVGQRQGINRDKDQIAMRRLCIERYGAELFPSVTQFIILGLSPEGGVVEAQDFSLGHATLHLRDLTWQAVSEIEVHPHAEEIRSYLAWKKRLTASGNSM